MILLFYNPANAKARKLLAKTQQFLSAKGKSWEAKGETSAIDPKLFSEVWILGGDGTVHFFLQRFKDWDLPIHVIPAGTGNDIIRHLYGRVPEIMQSLETGLQGQIRSLDAGVCNGHIFMNGVGIGFDGAVGHALAANRWWRGFLGYYFHVIRLLFFYKEQWEKTAFGQPIFMVTIGNGGFFGGGFHITPLADMQDGKLEVCCVNRVSRLQRIRNLLLLQRGRHLNLPFVKYFQATALTLEFEKPAPAHMDGEVFSAKQFEISILPGKYLFRSPV